MEVHADVHMDVDKQGNLTMAAQLMGYISQNSSYKRDLIDGPEFTLYTGNALRGSMEESCI